MDIQGIKGLTSVFEAWIARGTRSLESVGRKQGRTNNSCTRIRYAPGLYNSAEDGNKAPIGKQRWMQMQNGNKKQQQFCRGQLESARHPDVWFRFRERSLESVGGPKGGSRPWSSVACVGQDSRWQGGFGEFGLCQPPRAHFDVSLGGAQRAVPSAKQEHSQQPGLSDAQRPPLSTAASAALNCTVLCPMAMQVGGSKITRTNNSPRGQGRQSNIHCVQERVWRRCQVRSTGRTHIHGTDRRTPTPELLHTVRLCHSWPHPSIGRFL
jgi:hypothetical protein